MELPPISMYRICFQIETGNGLSLVWLFEHGKKKRWHAIRAPGDNLYEKEARDDFEADNTRTIMVNGLHSISYIALASRIDRKKAKAVPQSTSFPLCCKYVYCSSPTTVLLYVLGHQV
jgi:hypothetical protein